MRGIGNYAKVELETFGRVHRHNRHGVARAARCKLEARIVATLYKRMHVEPDGGVYKRLHVPRGVRAEILVYVRKIRKIRSYLSERFRSVAGLSELRYPRARGIKRTQPRLEFAAVSFRFLPKTHALPAARFCGYRAAYARYLHQLAIGETAHRRT